MNTTKTVKKTESVESISVTMTPREAFILARLIGPMSGADIMNMINRRSNGVIRTEKPELPIDQPEASAVTMMFFQDITAILEGRA